MEPASCQQALDAVQEFYAEHGRLPRWREWERATAARPCAKTIDRRWGWRELLTEVIGVKPNQVHASWEVVLDARGQAMLQSLRAARDELGRWPLAAEWDAAGRRPSARTFARHVGSWGERVGLTDHSSIRPETGDPPGPPAARVWAYLALPDAFGSPGPSQDVDAEIVPHLGALAVDLFRGLKDAFKVPHEVGLSLSGHHDERHVRLSERIAKLTSFEVPAPRRPPRLGGRPGTPTLGRGQTARSRASTRPQPGRVPFKKWRRASGASRAYSWSTPPRRSRRSNFPAAGAVDNSSRPGTRCPKP